MFMMLILYSLLTCASLTCYTAVHKGFRKTVNVSYIAPMDKVQFNNEVVSMRKVVKRVKVQVAKNLTRQIKQLRSKKGKPEELEKNKRRCDRLVEVVQAMKHWAPDDVTYSALIKSPTAKEAVETAREKALFRLINHPIFVKRLATFKDLVTPDLLRAKRRHKKAKKVSGAEKNIKDGQDASVVEKDDGEQDTDQRDTKPFEPDDDSESNEDDGAPFFLHSQKNESRELTNMKDSRMSNKFLTDLKSNEMIGAEDVVMSSSEDESDIHEEEEEKEKDDRGMSVPKVDLPNHTKQYPKSKHIPGISAPIGTKDPEIKDSFKHKKGRGASNISQHTSKLPQKSMPVKQNQTSFNGGRGRGRNTPQSSRGRKNSHLTSNRYKEPESKHSSTQAKTSKAHAEKNNDEKMHPSWLAKKNQRAGEKPVNFAGKKTTFSDD